MRLFPIAADLMPMATKSRSKSTLPNRSPTAASFTKPTHIM